MRRRIALALLFAFAALDGCNAAPQSRAHELRMALTLDPTSLSPLIAFSQDAIALDQFWCQTLVGLDEHNRFVPLLVTRVPSRQNGDISSDGLRITYRLRPDVRFADGVPFTSADVLFTYRAIFDPANAASGVDAYQRIASVTAPDAHTVVIRLRKAWAPAVNVFFAQGDFAYGILPKHAFASTKVVGSAWDDKPFGTGPFRVAVWHRGESIELEPNPYFRPIPKLKRIIIRIIPNQTSAFDAFQTHEVDTVELNPDNLAQAAALPGVRISRLAENGLRALYLQTQAEPTNDLHLRRALAFAIDLPALAKAWRGAYPPATSVFPAPLVNWHAAVPTPYPHDPARAGRELDAAGWRLVGNVRKNKGRPLNLLGAVDATNPAVGRILVLLQQQLAPLGIELTLKSYPTNVFSGPDGPLRTGRFSLTPSALIGGSDPEQSINLSCREARNGGDNYSRYCSRELEALFTRESSATSEAARRRDFDAIATLVHDDVPLIPLYDMLYIEGIAARVGPYRRNMLRYPVRPEEWDAR